MKESFIIARKDFLLCGKPVLTVMIAMIFLVIGLRLTATLAVLLFVPVIFALLCFMLDPIGSFALYALPVARGSHVIGRYIAVLAVFFLSLGLNVSLSLFADYPLNMNAIGQICLTVVFIIALLCPLNYLLSRTAALVASSLAMTLVGSAALVFVIVMEKSTGDPAPSFMLGLFQSSLFPYCASAAAAAMLTPSLLISMRIVSRKVL